MKGLRGRSPVEASCFPVKQTHLEPMSRFAMFAGLVLGLMAAGCSSPDAPVSGEVAPAGSFLKTNARVAVVDFFDMYCHTCQTEASHVVDLHRMVESRGMGSEVQFYGVGWGNTPLEAETYQRRFKVPFPVIADRDLSISKRYGSFRPPLLIALRREGGSWKEFYRTQHVMGRKDEVLNSILPR